MKDMNKIILIGRLGADPIQRETKNGIPVVHFSLATSRKKKSGGTDGDGDTELTEFTEWHKVVVWGREAQFCGQYLKKGDPVYVDGSIRSSKYVGKDGSERVAFEVHSDSVGFLGGRRRQGVEGEMEMAANE